MSSYSARLPQNREQYVQEAAMGARTPHAVPKPPWEGLDPHALARGPGFRLRLNPYQKTLLEEVARRNIASQHHTALRILVLALEAELGIRER